MTTPIFKDPGGQGLKQNIRCTTTPQSENYAKSMIFLSIILSENWCSQDYIELYKRK